MFLIPLNALFVYCLIVLGCALIAVRYLTLGIAGLILFLIPLEMLIRLLT